MAAGSTNCITAPGFDLICSLIIDRPTLTR